MIWTENYDIENFITGRGTLIFGTTLNDLSCGCKPSQEKIFGNGILCSSDSVFSPDSEDSFEKS